MSSSPSTADEQAHDFLATVMATYVRQSRGIPGPASGIPGSASSAPQASAQATATSSRPHVTLTYAQSLDGFLAPSGQRDTPFILSGHESMVLTHRMRTMHDAIMVGVQTVLQDDPRLTARLVPVEPPPLLQNVVTSSGEALAYEEAIHVNDPHASRPMTHRTSETSSGFWPQPRRTIVSQFGGGGARPESSMTLASEGAIIDGYTEAPSYAQEVHLQPSVPARRSSLMPPTYATIATASAAPRNPFLEPADVRDNAVSTNPASTNDAFAAQQEQLEEHSQHLPWTYAQPQPIILDTHFRFPTDCRLVAQVLSSRIEQEVTGSAATTNTDNAHHVLRLPWIVCHVNALTPKANRRKKAYLESLGGRVIPLDCTHPSGLDLDLVLRTLAGEPYSVQRVMVEGGAKVIQSFLRRPDLVDLMVITVAPLWLGSGLHVTRGEVMTEGGATTSARASAGGTDDASGDPNCSRTSLTSRLTTASSSGGKRKIGVGEQMPAFHPVELGEVVQQNFGRDIVIAGTIARAYEEPLPTHVRVSMTGG